MGIGFKAKVAEAHTPGPWILDDPEHDEIRSENADYHYINAGHGFHDGLTGTGFGLSGFMSEADARLIAAAPDLLAALSAVVDLCDDPNGSELNESLVWGLVRLLPAARTAIAKAEGAPKPRPVDDEANFFVTSRVISERATFQRGSGVRA